MSPWEGGGIENDCSEHKGGAQRRLLFFLEKNNASKKAVHEVRRFFVFPVSQ
jgi:hypothetical protein